MSGFSLADVHSGVFALLGGNALLRQRGWKVLDHVGERDATPYVVIGGSSGDDISAKDRPGMRVERELDFWSDERGYKLTLEAMREVHSQLHMRGVLFVDGVHTVRCRVVYVHVARDGDVKRHGIMRIEALTYGQVSVGIIDDENRLLEIPEEAE